MKILILTMILILGRADLAHCPNHKGRYYPVVKIITTNSGVEAKMVQRYWERR